MRVNYDLIAHLYDSGPHRGKEVDAALLAFLALVRERVAASQLIAMVDADYEAGMAKVAEDVNGRHTPTFSSEICLITLGADKPGGSDAY